MAANEHPLAIKQINYYFHKNPCTKFFLEHKLLFSYIFWTVDWNLFKDDFLRLNDFCMIFYRVQKFNGWIIWSRLWEYVYLLIVLIVFIHGLNVCVTDFLSKCKFSFYFLVKIQINAFFCIIFGFKKAVWALVQFQSLQKCKIFSSISFLI